MCCVSILSLLFRLTLCANARYRWPSLIGHRDYMALRSTEVNLLQRRFNSSFLRQFNSSFLRTQFFPSFACHWNSWVANKLPMNSPSKRYHANWQPIAVMATSILIIYVRAFTFSSLYVDKFRIRPDETEKKPPFFRLLFTCHLYIFHPSCHFFRLNFSSSLFLSRSTNKHTTIQRQAKKNAIQWIDWSLRSSQTLRFCDGNYQKLKESCAALKHIHELNRLHWQQYNYHVAHNALGCIRSAL